MWGILLCTVGVAALTSKYKRGNSDVKLGEPRVIDSISVRLPKGWKISRDGSDGWRAREGAHLQRVILVRERDPEELSLLERFIGSNSSSTPRGGKSSGIPVGPVTGTLSSTRSEHGDGEADEILTQVTARLPNEHRLTIMLGGFVADDEDETDAIELVQQIAKSVEYLPGKK